MGVFVFAPNELPHEKRKILALLSSLSIGLFGFFLTGSIELIAEGSFPGWGKLSLQAGGGAALFVFTMLWWSSPLAPVKEIADKIDDVHDTVKAVGKDVSTIVELLKEELQMKNSQIAQLQSLLDRNQAVEPSDRAKELAAQIPEDSGPYALALKAIAEKRFDQARGLLEKAQKEKEVEVSDIYLARGQTETYAGNHKDAVVWYEKSLALNPDDVNLINATGIALFQNAEYDKAEPLMRRALEIDQASFGKDHPNVARDLNNLAMLLKDTNRLGEAEPLMRRVLEIFEAGLGSEHPNTRIVRGNLEALISEATASGKVEAGGY